jgi:predicted ArsR family transcriptional regulator
MATKTDLSKTFGRKEFTVRELADRTGQSIETARSRLTRYLEQGLVERTDDVLQYVDDKGRALRGRPAHLYRVV